MKYDIHEAAAAVAANHRMNARDVLDITRIALSMMTVVSMAIILL